MRQCVLFNIAVLVVQCLTGQAPSYLAAGQLVSDVRPCRLRSSDLLTCVVRRTRNTYGDRCFAAAEPLVWNSLSAVLRQCHSLEQFRRRLKTHFFVYGTTALCDCLVNSTAQNFSYLLTLRRLCHLLAILLCLPITREVKNRTIDFWRHCVNFYCYMYLQMRE